MASELVVVRLTNNEDGEDPGDNGNSSIAPTESDTAALEVDKGSTYVRSEDEQWGGLADKAQTEDMPDEDRRLVWNLLKQVGPDMDLSDIPLPTSVLEPHSFLEKLADFYYHVDILNEAVLEDDRLERMIKVVKFYLSGFYKKPKGLKKPYNPILGEVFRCKWEHPDGSTTFYVAEQVSQDPPISSLFVTNRRAGFNIAGTILVKKECFGTSLSAVMQGRIRIDLLARGETYSVTLPFAHCEGMMIGPLAMEYAGQVKIESCRTKYVCTISFQVKGLLGGDLNVVNGTINLGNEILAKINGIWDKKIILTTQTGQKRTLWAPDEQVIKQRLPRFEIPLDSQKPWESKKLWLKVSNAISNGDLTAATEEKRVVESAQGLRAESGIPHKQRYFRHNRLTGNYDYIYADHRPWDENKNVEQVESQFVIYTKSKPTRSSGSTEAGSRLVHARLVHPPSTNGTDDSGSSVASRRHKCTKKQRNGESERLKQIQETLDRSMETLKRIESRVDSLEGTFDRKLIIMLVVLAVLQSVVLRMFFSR